MEIESPSPYLPTSSLKDFLCALKANIAYRVWKRKLRKHGGFHEGSNLKILEVGCGPGYFLRCAEKWFPNCELHGLDLDESLLNFVARHSKKAKLTRHNAHFLPYSENSFDVIVTLQVIEHLLIPEDFSTEANRVLKSEGLLLLATPNPSGIPAIVLKNKWHSYHNNHISLRTPQQWRNAIRDSRFRIIEDGTTALSGFGTLQKLPFAIINWIPLAIFGYFPWYKGESYMAIAKKM